LREQIERVRSGEAGSNYPREWPRKPGEKPPPGVMDYSAKIGKTILKRKREIRKKLDSEACPLYPRDSVRSVLKFWNIEL
jgi:hypothetical protein